MSAYPSISSGKISSSQIVTSSACRLSGILVKSDGTNTATVVVYDNTSAAGKILWEVSVTGAQQFGGRNWIFPVIADNGLYCEISGTNAAAIVEYV